MKINDIRIVYVLDTETTGLTGYPNDHIVELAINKVDLNKKKFKTVFNKIIGHDTSKWHSEQKEAWIFRNTDLTLEMVQKADRYHVYKEQLYLLLNKRNCTSYNRAFDFVRFLNHEPYNFHFLTNIFPCIMLEASEICKIPGYYNGYKWPSLDQAYRMIVGKSIKQTHRAVDDTNAASEILLELVELSLEDKKKNSNLTPTK